MKPPLLLLEGQVRNVAVDFGVAVNGAQARDIYKEDKEWIRLAFHFLGVSVGGQMRPPLLLLEGQVHNVAMNFSVAVHRAQATRYLQGR